MTETRADDGLAGTLALLLRLKSQLLVNSFRRSPWQVVAIVLGIVYGGIVTLLAVVLLVGLRAAPLGVAQPIVVIGGSVVVLGFLLVPLVLGVDDTLDPRRFALFGIERTRLALGLGIAALLGIPAIVIVVVAIATIVTWSRSPGAVIVALLAAPLIVATCVLFARISSAAAGLLLSTRRSREALTAIVLIGIVLLAPVLVVLTNIRLGRGADAGVQTAARVLGYTPLGAAWAAPASIAGGNLRGVLQLVIAIAVVGLLWLAWRGLVGLVVVTPPRQGRAQSYRGLGWFGRLPATPAGAIAARSFTYWGRDVRYRISVAMVPITPVLIVVPLLVAGVPGTRLALIPIPVVALFLGWIGHDDVAYDSTAIWLHVAAGTRGLADRLGRAAPVIAAGVPVVVAGSFVCAAIYGRPAAVLPLIGVSGCVLLSGLGFSFVSSARFPYPVPKPGASPFQQPNSVGGLTAAVQSVTFFAQFVIAAPAIALGVFALLRPEPSGLFLASFATGLVTGVLVFAIGLAIGSRTFQRRGPELLASALRA